MTSTAALWKGKGRENAKEFDLDELNPVITYRHLLSSGLGVRNPLRVCALTDMDAFYAACEQNRLGIDPSIPLVVRQWDALIAVNYPARTYGISRMDKISSALQRCPHLRVVHVATFDPSVPDAKPTYIENPNSETQKVSLDYYRKESKKIMDVFKEMLPGAEVERASIDEAFIDFTEPVRQRILADFPHFANPPAEGLDSPLPPPPSEGFNFTYPASRAAANGKTGGLWSDLGTLVPICRNPPDPPSPARAGEEFQGILEPIVSGTQFTSGDIIEDDKVEGVSSDIFIASTGRSRSLEAEDAQPNEGDLSSLNDEVDPTSLAEASRRIPGSSVFFDEDRPPTWHDVALSVAASLLLKMRDEVKTRLGYTTSAGIARNKFLAKLVASYKKRDSQSILRNAAIPNYLRPLPFQKIRFLGGKLGTAIAEAYDAQTVGDLLSISIEEMQSKFGENSIWVWEILRGIDRSEVKEKPPVTKSMGASKNLQHPITHPSEGAHWLRILAGELAFRLTEAREENPGLWPKTLVLHVRQSYNTTRSKQAPFPYARAAGIDFICKAAEKLWMELVGTGAEYDKDKARGMATQMKVTNVFLGFTGVETMSAGQRSIEGFFSSNEGLGKRKAKESEGGVRDEGTKRRKATGQSKDPDSTAISTSVISFDCPRCGKQIRCGVNDVDDRETALNLLRMEHDDFHFAQDLEREGSGSDIQTSGGKNKKKVKAEAKGIAKFFSPVVPKR